MNRIDMHDLLLKYNYTSNNNLYIYENIFNSTNFTDLSNDELKLVLSNNGIENIFTIYNYLKDIDMIKLFMDMCETSKKLEDYGNTFNYRIDFLKDYNNFKKNIKSYNKDYDNKGIHVINDLLKINQYNRLSFRINLFECISNYDKKRSFELETKILILTLFGKDFLNKYYNLFDNENNYILDIDKYDNHSFKRLIKNIGRNFNYYDNDNNIKFDLENFETYLNNDVKPYIETIFELYENDIIKDKRFMYKLIYKLNHSKVRKFVFDYYNQKIELDDIEKDYDRFIPKSILQ
ncbi:hypothetical protein CPT_Machias_217 [Staphylococcus phage Machias]|nr:hypothetical protein CPT_Machias_217 [Staphylococcus phage Machias]